MDTKPFRLKLWPEELGLELEEALALLVMLQSIGSNAPDLSHDIAKLQDLIASKEVEKMLGGNDGD